MFGKCAQIDNLFIVSFALDFPELFNPSQLFSFLPFLLNCDFSAEGHKERHMDRTYANIVIPPSSCKSSLTIRLKVCTINWLVMLMPVYCERNGFHLAPLRWKSLEVVEQEIANGAGDKLAEVEANTSLRNANSSGVIV